MRILLLIALGMFAGYPEAAADDPPELVEYIQGIRDHRATDSAWDAVSMIAGIRLGFTVIEFTRDASSGNYWPRYTSTTCPVPGADPDSLAAWSASVERQREAETAALRPFADQDGSGFVTTEEGFDFRFLVEFGIMASQVAQAEDLTLEALGRASGKSADEAEARLIRYRELADAVAAAGLDPLPVVTLVQSEKP